MLFFKKKKPLSKYRIRIDGWLYIANGSVQRLLMTQEVSNAKEFDSFDDAMYIAKQIKSHNVVIVENRDGRTKFHALG